MVAANVLIEPLTAGHIGVKDLAEVQRQREWPTRVIQTVQSAVQKRVLANVLRSQGPIKVPWALRVFFQIPILRDVPARLMAFGPKRVRIDDP